MRDEYDSQLAWNGRGAPAASAGFADRVGLNEQGSGLAVDPEGILTAERPVRGAAGLGLAVTRLDVHTDGCVQPSGRVRLA